MTQSISSLQNKKDSIIQLCCLFMLTLVSFHAYSQKHNILNYSTRDGLASQIVNDVFQDKDGYLWFATQSGISKFNGHEFNEFAPIDDLMGVDAVNILQDNKGRIIIGTNTNGLFIYDYKKTINFNEKKGLSTNVIRRLFLDNKGVVWVMTDKGIYQLIEDKLLEFTDKNHVFKKGVLSMTQTVNGDYWFGTQGNGLVSFSKNKFSYFTAKDGILDDYIFSMASYGDSVLIGTTNSGVIVRHNNTFQKLPVSDIQNAWISAILPSKNGMHIISSSGLILYKTNGSFEVISEKNGLASNDLYNGYFDREKNLWLTSGNGISCLRKEEIISLDKEAGLSDEKITSIAKLQDGRIIAGTYGSGLNILSAKGTILKQLLPEELKNVKITAIQEVPAKKELWIGVEQSNYGIIILNTDKDKFTVKKTIQRINGVYIQTVTKIAVDKQNRVWISTFNAGLFRISAKDTVQYNTTNILPSNEVYTFLIDQKDQPWVSLYQKGLYQLKNNQFIRVVDKNLLNDKFIQCIEQDADGVIYIGTKSHGITLIDNGKFTQINKNNGLNSNSIQALVKKHNQLWVGTDRGIHLIKSKKDGTFSILTYDERSGLSNLEIQQNALLATEDVIWVGSTTGLSRINRKESEHSNIKPFIELKTVKLFYNTIDWSQKSGVQINKLGTPINLNLPYKENHLTFEYCALTNSSVSYSFYLSGEDSEWSPLTDKREVTYSNLNPGTYEFNVKSIDNFGVESEVLVIPIIINSPFYQTWWFRILSILIIAIIIYSYIRVRERNYRERQSILEETVQERTKEVVLKNKEILDSITYAKRIQNAMLPSQQTLKQEFKEIFIFYQPKDIVAGDFYWFEKINHKLLFAVADCTGHGVPGAMVSVVCNNALNRVTREYGVIEPAQILNKTRELILLEFSKSQGEVNDGMDISLVLFDPKTKQLEWSGANNSLWILKKGELEISEIKGDKQPVGRHINNHAFTNHSLELEDGDIFYLLSDGFSDQFGGAKGKKLKSAGLKELLLKVSARSMDEQELAMKTEFNSWKGTQEQVDDICLVGIRI